jgi:GNAT superfamily N-acetyltransferase
MDRLNRRRTAPGHPRAGNGDSIASAASTPGERTQRPGFPGPRTSPPSLAGLSLQETVGRGAPYGSELAARSPGLPAEAMRARRSGPIESLKDAEAFHDATLQLFANLAGWRAQGETTLASTWNDRVSAVTSVLSGAHPDAEGVAYVAYVYQGQKIGLMSMSRGEHPLTRGAMPYTQIHALVAAHPGVRGAGARLVEHAVNESQRQGLRGCIRLDPLWSAVPAYRAMGFVEENTLLPRMLLDPVNSDRWHWGDGEWRYSGRDDETRIAAPDDSDEPRGRR